MIRVGVHAGRLADPEQHEWIFRRSCRVTDQVFAILIEEQTLLLGERLGVLGRRRWWLARRRARARCRHGHGREH